MRELYEADLHKSGSFRSRRVWANAWDMFRWTPSRAFRGRRAVVHYVVCLCVWPEFIFVRICLLRTHTACCKYDVAFLDLPQLMKRVRFRVPLFRSFVGLHVCVTFVVFTDCECCTRAISTHPSFMQMGKYGLTRGTWFVARRLEMVAVAGLLGFGGVFWVRRYFVFYRSFFL